MVPGIYDQAIELCQKYLDTIDGQNAKIIVFLDSNPEWLETIKTKTKGDQHIITISDSEKFKSFIHANGCNKMYINLTVDGESGIDFAEKLRLKDGFGELVFVSADEPTSEDMTRIDQLGAKFISKSRLLDNIIYPKN